MRTSVPSSKASWGALIWARPRWADTWAEVSPVTSRNPNTYRSNGPCPAASGSGQNGATAGALLLSAMDTHPSVAARLRVRRLRVAAFWTVAPSRVPGVAATPDVAA